MQNSKDGVGPALSASSPDTRETQDHDTMPKEMDRRAPDTEFSQPSPADRRKRAAQSPALSPNKAPLLKKQHWDPPAAICPEVARSDSLATLLASEHTLKLMLLYLQKICATSCSPLSLCYTLELII